MPNAQSHNPYPRPRFAVLLAAAAAAIVIAIAAFQGGVSLQSSATANPAAKLSPLTLSDRVLPASALPGFIKTADPAVMHSALSWATNAERSADSTSEAQRLHRVGFVAGVDEHLHGRFPLAAEAVSVVERFRSAVDARAELAHQRQSTLASEAGPALTIGVMRGIGISGAFGWVTTSPQMTGINVIFTSGSYVYLVGSGAAPGTHGAPTQAQVAAAAQFVNLLTHGCVSRAGVSKTGSPTPISDQSSGRTWLLH
jgi:hypothetical protein